MFSNTIYAKLNSITEANEAEVIEAVKESLYTPVTLNLEINIAVAYEFMDAYELDESELATFVKQFVLKRFVAEQRDVKIKGMPTYPPVSSCVETTDTMPIQINLVGAEAMKVQLYLETHYKLDKLSPSHIISSLMHRLANQRLASCPKRYC